MTIRETINTIRADEAEQAVDHDHIADADKLIPRSYEIVPIRVLQSLMALPNESPGVPVPEEFEAEYSWLPCPRCGADSGGVLCTDCRASI